MKKTIYLPIALTIIVTSLFITFSSIQANSSDNQIQSSGGTGIISDDFNSCTLASQWTFSDPLGDSTLTLNGTQALIEVPMGTNHDVWEGVNTAPRLTQAMDNTDFEIEVQFDTTVNSKFQIQGVLIEQDDNNKLRFDFFNNGEESFVFYAKFENGEVTESSSTAIASSIGLAMRIRRQGSVYSQEYRINNEPWKSHIAVTYIGLDVSQFSVFVGNVGTADPAPAFTSAIDYVFNTSSPISPEDNDTFTLNSSVTGSGTLDVSPVRSSYTCGEEVTLTPSANMGSVFTGWSGSISGHGSPKVINIMGDTTVIANFATATDYVYMPFVSNVEEIILPTDFE